MKLSQVAYAGVIRTASQFIFEHSAGVDSNAQHGYLASKYWGALESELVGRYLFFRSVVPLGLAGNFFAGNQRE